MTQDSTARGAATLPLAGKAGRALWSSQALMPEVLDDRFVIVRGEGAFVEDQAGNRLLDVGSGLWHANVGHGARELAQAAYQQMLELETYHTFGRSSNPRALELADRLSELSPMPNTRVFLTSGGSDCVDAAAKLVRRYWVATGQPEKRVIVTRTGGYHGLHAYGTSLAGIESNREGYGTDSLVPETIRVPATETEPLARLLGERGGEIAAVLLEAVIGTGGFLPPPAGYLEQVQTLCEQHDVLLVLDEVITGYGRTGSLFAAQRFALRPDIMLTAKGLTSGYAPLGALLVGERVAAPFWTGERAVVFRHGLTYSGHATACAVALANLDLLSRRDLVARVAALEPMLARSLGVLAGHPAVAEIRGPVGFMAGVRLADEGLVDIVTRVAAQHGLLVRAVSGGVLGICPPFVIDEDDLAAIGQRLSDSLDHVWQRAGLG